MNEKLNILLIALDAPPKNTAEAIQTGRILKELDTHAAGRLIISRPGTARAWGQRDSSLTLALRHFDTQELALPFHRILHRVLTSHRLARLHVPDSAFWIAFMAGSVIRGLKNAAAQPNIIYSRSCPMSGALLALKLKQKLHLPWLMHLSDPWAENPYKAPHSQDRVYEATCFHAADLVSLTTEGQAEYYRKKYPDLAKKIIVSPNVMPDKKELELWLNAAKPHKNDPYLHIVFAGNLYGSRSPEPLVKALEIIAATRPELLSKLRIDFYGNMQAPILALLRQTPHIHYHGPVSFGVALASQHAADIALTIEADSDDVFIKNTLLSKVMDCLAMGKTMLSITPEESETARICALGYGCAVPPSDVKTLAAAIIERIEHLAEFRASASQAPPPEYRAKNVVEDIVKHMERLVSKDFT